MITAITLENLGEVNKNKVVLTDENGRSCSVYFPYSTVVAVDGMVSHNDWSVTTGRLLNELEPDKKKRVSQDEVISYFNEKMAELQGTKREQ